MTSAAAMHGLVASRPCQGSARPRWSVCHFSQAEPSPGLTSEDRSTTWRRPSQSSSTFERWRYGQMNRQPRRNLARRLASNDPGLTMVHSNAGGTDVGNESHFVAVPPDRDPHPAPEFGCWTAD